MRKVESTWLPPEMEAGAVAAMTNRYDARPHCSGSTTRRGAPGLQPVRGKGLASGRANYRELFCTGRPSGVTGRGRFAQLLLLDENEGRGDPCSDENDLTHRMCVGPAAMESGNEIGHRDVQKTRGGHRQAVRKNYRHHFQGNEREDGAARARQTGRDIEQQGASARVAGVKQDGEVAYLLRDLMCRDGESGAHAERHRGHHRGGDHRAVDEVVEGITDQNWKNAPVMHFAIMGVAMAPENQFLQHKEHEYSPEKRREYPRGGKMLERFWKDGEHRHAEQGAHRVAHEPGDQSCAT